MGGASRQWFSQIVVVAACVSAWLELDARVVVFDICVDVGRVATVWFGKLVIHVTAAARLLLKVNGIFLGLSLLMALLAAV